jgi:hypothetical protein
MTKFLLLWRLSLLAPWSSDRREAEENVEAKFDAMERFMDAGMVKENAFFVDGNSGCFIFEGTSQDLFRMTSRFSPFIEYDVREMIPYEIGKDTVLESLHEKTLER